MSSPSLTQDTGGPRQSYGAVSRINHWLTAALFLGALALGLTMEYAPLERETKMTLMDPHKALGVSVLLYGIWRVGWRLVRGFPAPAGDDPKWQTVAAKAVHYALLAAIIAMPLSGIAMTVFNGRPLDIAGVTLLASPGKVEWIANAAHAVHGLAGKAAAILVALHLAAALKHHFIDRDATLRRMTRDTTAA